MSNQLTAIDLFAGAGGFSLAAHQQDFDILAAVEFDKQASETYHYNLVERLGAQTQVFHQDINKVDIQNLMKFQGIKQGELDLLLGGPPCQGYSAHRINNAGIEDPRNQLLIRYFDFVSALRPKVFLVENVPGLLWKKHELFLNKFLGLARSYNYKVVSNAPLIINSRDFGVPQNRKRAFILAVREDLNLTDLSWPPKATHFAPSSEKAAWKTASSVFEKPPFEVLQRLIERIQQTTNLGLDSAKLLVNKLEFGSPLSASDPCNFHMKHSDALTQRFIETPLNGSREDIAFRLKCHSEGYKGHKDVYGRIFLNTPSNTITTGCNNPSKGRFVHPWFNHGITLRHAARLQNFPDDYIFKGTSTEQARQVGNAVPIGLGNALIESIKHSILMKNLSVSDVA
ncbi:MAG: DNA (cytosine-5)-methyltransferase 1 [Colwellia sp.]|jgi:DNA (cytosine-5)-methyltransferase 1